MSLLFMDGFDWQDNYQVVGMNQFRYVGASNTTDIYAVVPDIRKTSDVLYEGNAIINTFMTEYINFNLPDLHTTTEAMVTANPLLGANKHTFCCRIKFKTANAQLRLIATRTGVTHWFDFILHNLSADLSSNPTIFCGDKESTQTEGVFDRTYAPTIGIQAIIDQWYWLQIDYVLDSVSGYIEVKLEDTVLFRFDGQVGPLISNPVWRVSGFNFEGNDPSISGTDIVHLDDLIMILNDDLEITGYQPSTSRVFFRAIGWDLSDPLVFATGGYNLEENNARYLDIPVYYDPGPTDEYVETYLWYYPGTVELMATELYKVGGPNYSSWDSLFPKAVQLENLWEDTRHPYTYDPLGYIIMGFVDAGGTEFPIDEHAYLQGYSSTINRHLNYHLQYGMAYQHPDGVDWSFENIKETKCFLSLRKANS